MTQQSRRILVASAIAGGALGIAVILRFPPGQYPYYPQCPVFATLHLLCPGCGSTRAFAALLHGDLLAALHLNLLFILLLPFLTGYALLCGWRAWTAEAFQFPAPPQLAIHGILAAALLFTLVRNLPA